MSYQIIYKLDGEVVTEAQWLRARRRRKRRQGRAMIHKPLRHSQTIVSESLAVHPVDAAQAEANARKAGHAVHFDDLGRPHFSTFAQRDAYAKSQGFHARTRRDRKNRRKF